MANSKGQKLSFTVINIGDYSDWVASMQVIQQNLKAVGIQVTPDNLTNTDFTAALYTGKFQLAYYDQQTFGPEPVLRAAELAGLGDTAPIGKTATTNYERYSNPADGQAVHPVRVAPPPTTRAALDHQPAAAGHADPAADHPGGPGGRLVPVQRPRT